MRNERIQYLGIFEGERERAHHTHADDDSIEKYSLTAVKYVCRYIRIILAEQTIHGDYEYHRRNGKMQNGVSNNQNRASEKGRDDVGATLLLSHGKYR